MGTLVGVEGAVAEGLGAGVEVAEGTHVGFLVAVGQGGSVEEGGRM